MSSSSYAAKLKSDLARLDSAYHREPAPAAYAVPDGRYVTVVEDVILGHAQSTGNPMIKFMLRIEGPKMQSRVLWKRRIITGNTVPYLKQELQTLGIVLKDLSELPDRVPEMVGLRVEVTKRQNGDWEDVYFHRKSGEEGLPF